MADDVTLPGTGAVIATDDVGGRQVQLVKPAFGADGAATLVDSANPLPAQSPSLTVSGSASAVGAITASADVSAFSQVYVHMSGTYNGTARLQGSADNSTWVSISTVAYSSSPPLSGGYIGSTSSLGSGTSSYSAVYYRYYRVAFTAYTSGTATAIMTATTAPPPTAQVSIQGFNINAEVYVRNSGSNSVSDAVGSSSWAPVSSLQFGYNGASFDRLRTPSTFRTVSTAASGNAALWVPTSGNRWRLQRFMVMLTGDAAISSGGVLTIDLQDNTTSINTPLSVYVPGTGGTALGGWNSGWIDLGNGRLSGANTQTLNVNLSAALTSGTCRVIACGTEGVGTAA